MLEAINRKIIMGASSSRGDNGCWAWSQSRNDEKQMMKRPKKLPSKLRLKIGGGQNNRRNRDETFEWEEIPTPSICDHRDTIHSADTSPTIPPSAPTQERLMQIISCFPYPTSRSSSPSATNSEKAQNDHRAFCDAFGRLVQVSVETMAITALPMDIWLKERLKKWVQLSGHEGSIVPATPHTLYKKQCANCGEGRAYKNIAKDRFLTGFTPKYYNELEKNEEHFIEIEDLLQQFADPTKTAIMDIKIGTRTFLESEVSNTKKRGDLFEKMMAIDGDEPNDEERKCRAITKLRYMQFRERESSTAQLGFRIEAAKRLEGTLEKNFKKVRTVDDVATTFVNFFGDQRNRCRRELIDRLKAMRKAIENSTFFAEHEVVGSSILIVFDTEKIGCWMIDFAKSSPVGQGRSLNHRTPWVPGNNEDGYLIGIDNLIKIFEDLPEYGKHPDDQLLVTEEVVARMKSSKSTLS